jgi:hypothetical protein
VLLGTSLAPPSSPPSAAPSAPSSPPSSSPALPVFGGVAPEDPLPEDPREPDELLEEPEPEEPRDPDELEDEEDDELPPPPALGWIVDRKFVLAFGWGSAVSVVMKREKDIRAEVNFMVFSFACGVMRLCENVQKLSLEKDDGLEVLLF